MVCYQCDLKMKARRERSYHYYECGLPNIYLKGVTVWFCPHCGFEEVEIPDPNGLQTEIARILVSKESRLSGKEFRFLRTFLGFSGAHIATRFFVSRETVSRWETGTLKVPGPADIALRYMVLTGKANYEYKVTHINQILEDRRRIKRLEAKFDDKWKVESESA